MIQYLIEVPLFVGPGEGHGEVGWRKVVFVRDFQPIELVGGVPRKGEKLTVDGWRMFVCCGASHSFGYRPSGDSTHYNSTTPLMTVYFEGLGNYQIDGHAIPQGHYYPRASDVRIGEYAQDLILALEAAGFTVKIGPLYSTAQPTKVPR